MGMAWSEYIDMPYNAAMAAWEGYIIRTQKMDSNFREVAYQIICSFADHNDPDFPKTRSKYWHLNIDDLSKKEKKRFGIHLTPEQLLKIRNG